MSETVVVVGVVSCAIAPAIWLWWLHWDSVNVNVQGGLNDDDTAATTFTDILGRAQEALIVHDDGNKAKGTVYDNPVVIDAFRRQLADNESLHIRCLFNDREDLDLVRQMRSEFPDRFKVRYRIGARPPGDVHYKIADDGTIGHLSSHEHGQLERKFKLLDCSDAKQRTRKRALGKYIDQFEVGFAEAAE